jgi:hypothetical protein
MNRTHSLPACNAVPQPTAPPHAPGKLFYVNTLPTIEISGEYLQHISFSYINYSPLTINRNYHFFPEQFVVLFIDFELLILNQTENP